MSEDIRGLKAMKASYNEQHLNYGSMPKESGGMLTNLNEELATAATRVESCTRVLNALGDMLFGPTEPTHEKDSAAIGANTKSHLNRLHDALSRLERSIQRFDGGTYYSRGPPRREHGLVCTKAGPAQCPLRSDAKLERPWRGRLLNKFGSLR